MPSQSSAACCRLPLSPACLPISSDPDRTLVRAPICIVPTNVVPSGYVMVPSPSGTPSASSPSHDCHALRESREPSVRARQVPGWGVAWRGGALSPRRGASSRARYTVYGGTALVLPGNAREGSPREDTSASGHANAICTPHQRHLGGGPHAAHGRASIRTPRAVRQERASQRERQRQASCHRRAGLQAARLSERGCLWLLYGGAMRRLERLRMSHARNAGGVRQRRGRGRSERRARPPASMAHA